MANKEKGENTPRERKVASGPVREKSRTMEKLVEAVGTVILQHGYPGLTVANVGKAAGVDRKLIYTYFGSLDKLIETYITQKDYWKSKATGDIEGLLVNPETIGRAQVNALIQGQFDTVFDNEALQKIIHWEIGEKNQMLQELAASREELGELVFKIIDVDFEGTSIDLRAILALQISGIYYLCLHAKSNGSTFCGIDINLPDGKQRISAALKRIIGMAYDYASVDK